MALSYAVPGATESIGVGLDIHRVECARHGLTERHQFRISVSSAEILIFARGGK